MHKESTNSRGWNCLTCPNKVCMLTHEELPTVTWFYVLHKDKHYQPIWYHNKDLFRIYEDGEIVLEMKRSDTAHITPANFADKLQMLITFS